MPHPTPLADQVAIVTGASSGIGEATAIALAARGAKVVLCARREGRLKALKERIEAAGGTAMDLYCDVRDRHRVQAVVDAAVMTWGRVDVLINNAGVMPVSPIASRRFDDWDRMIDINIKGALYAIGAVLPVMQRQHRGHIVNISSVAGRNVFPGNAVYCATKHALHVISEGLRAELAQATPPEHGIRVTIIAPGVVLTELPESTTDESLRDSIRSWYTSMPGALTSEDIARTILFAVESPAHVNVNEILVRPAAQAR